MLLFSVVGLSILPDIELELRHTEEEIFSKQSQDLLCPYLYHSMDISYPLLLKISSTLEMSPVLSFSGIFPAANTANNTSSRLKKSCTIFPTSQKQKKQCR